MLSTYSSRILSIGHYNSFVTMRRNIILLIFVFGFLAAEAQPQAKPEPKNSSEESGEDAEDDPQALKDLVENLKKTFDEMIKIAKKDNPEIGAAVEKKLNAKKAAAEKILADSLKESAATGSGSGGRGKKNHRHKHRRGPKNGEGERGQKRRPKRAAPSALDQIGQLLVESYADTKADVAKLSPEAKCAYYNAYKTGVMKCTADPCVNKQKRLSRVCGDDE